jgi:polygalacturonase
MIYAKGASDIKIGGEGTIDGLGYHSVWKNMKYSEHLEWNVLLKQVSNNISPKNRKYGPGHSLRPDLIAFYECTRIHISGVRIINSPYWGIHPVMSSHVTIQDCKISSNGYDQVGVAIESSQNVFVDGISIRENGEGIKFLSGRTDISNNQSSSNIIVQNCSFQNIIHF